MAADPQLELRVSRLENDRNSMYDMIVELQATQREHTQRFDRMDRRLDGIDKRLDGVDKRFDGVDKRFDGVDKRFDGVEATLAEVLRRLPDPS